MLVDALARYTLSGAVHAIVSSGLYTAKWLGLSVTVRVRAMNRDS